VKILLAIVMVFASFHADSLADAPKLGDNFGVEVGEFKWDGKIYPKAKAMMADANTIKVTLAYGKSVDIPWEKADAGLQFKLRPEREKLVAKSKI